MARPTDRAMKAAVSMEVHAACATRTIDKARALDDEFPGYDEMRIALIDAQICLAMLTKPKDIRSPSASYAMAEAITAELKCRAALSKAEGRSLSSASGKEGDHG